MLSANFIQLLVGMVLIFVAIEDMLRFKIANESIIVLALLFLVFSLVSGALWPPLWHLMFGAIMFAVVLAAYSYGVVGGGDAKLLAVAFLWMGAQNATLFCLLLSGAAGVYLVLQRLFHILPGKTNAAGRFMIPYGPCIAAAWITTMVLKPYS
jgi:prepilin peptidase CpaA